MDQELGGIIKSIMSNPEFNNLVNELKGPEGTPASPDDIMKKLPEVLGMLGKTSAGGKSESPQTLTEAVVSTSAEAKKSSAENAVIEQALTAIRKMDNQKCERLLGALKPYLRPQRGEVIDKAVSVMKITDILGALQDAGLNP